MHEALSYGVPMVVHPQMIEQSIVGRQIALLGAGLQLTTISGASGLASNTLLGAAEIREAVDTAIDDPRFAKSARRLGREFPPDTPARFADIVSRVIGHGNARAA